MSRAFTRVLSLSSIWLLAAIAGFAQVDVATATLKGTLTDTSNAVDRGATVIGRSIDRGISRQSTTDAEGDYQIP